MLLARFAAQKTFLYADPSECNTCVDETELYRILVQMEFILADRRPTAPQMQDRIEALPYPVRIPDRNIAVIPAKNEKRVG